MNEIHSKIKNIETLILFIRGHRVMIDADLAKLYGTSTKALNQAVKRNKERFPSDFMFQLSIDEKDELVTVCDHLSILKFSKSLPYVFTEHGAIMAASILNTPIAIVMSVLIVRAFVKTRKLLSNHKELAKKLSELEQKLEKHDEAITAIFHAIKKLMNQNIMRKSKTKRIGF